ncbi:MAG: class I SAM-dependent methyltransferase [Anaerolineae bacterium]|jgi:ABC-2 type transport system ATP-binding protein
MVERKEVYWSKFADTFDEDQRYIVGEAVQQAVIRRLAEERELGKVIELGCGRGYFTKAIAGNATRILATDLSDEMVEAARSELSSFEHITVQKVDCASTAFPAERFDTALMVNVVHFIENPDQCLAESYRILKPGGVLLVADYTAYGTKWFEMMKMGIKFMLKWGMPPRYAQRGLSPDGLRALVEGAGFQIEELQVVGDRTRAVYLKGRKT